MSQPERLTRRQAAIIGTYTGVTCGPFCDVHDYIASLPQFEGITSMALTAFTPEDFRRAAEADFMAICAVLS